MSFPPCWCGGRPEPSVHPLYGRCPDCGCQVLSRRYTPDELKAFYGLEHYWRGHVVRTSGYPSIDRRARSDMTERVPYWHALVTALGGRPASLLEIGCAHGGFLAYCRDHGIPNVAGVEVDEATCRFARKTFGLRHVVGGLFPDVTLPRDRFDIIAGFDVLEHFPDQIGALAAVRDRLTPQGRFIFQTPCWRGEDAAWTQFRPEEHLYLHTEDSLKRLFARSGLRLDFLAPGLFPDDVYAVGGRADVPRPTGGLALIRSDAIGDAVVFGRAVTALARSRPDLPLTVICQTHLAELYRDRPEIADVIAFPVRTLRESQAYQVYLARALAQRRFAVALNAVYSREEISDFLTINTQAPDRLALREDPVRLVNRPDTASDVHYTRLLDTSSAWEPETVRHRDLLTGLGIAHPDIGPEILPGPADHAWAEAFYRHAGLDPERVVLLVCGAGSPKRLYAGYGTALRELREEFGLTVIALGAQADRRLATANQRDLGAPVLDLCGRTTLLQAAALIARARLTCGAETGLTHMAAALGRPHAVLLGGGHCGRFMPLVPETSIACLPLACYGCDWKCRYKTCHCVSGLDPQVFAAACRHALGEDWREGRVFTQAPQDYRPAPDGPAWALPAAFLTQAPQPLIGVEPAG